MHAIYIVDRAVLQKDPYTDFTSHYCLVIPSKSGPYICNIFLNPMNYMSSIEYRKTLF